MPRRTCIQTLTMLRNKLLELLEVELLLRASGTHCVLVSARSVNSAGIEYHVLRTYKCCEMWCVVN